MADDMEYEVGYRKPPKAFQFPKGRSGNSSGRPRKVLGIAEVLWKVANQKVLVHEKNGPRYMTKLEACATQLGNKGTTGDLKAVKDFIQMLALYPLAGATQKDMEATASSAKAKLLALLEARDGSLAEGAPERDRLSGHNEGNAIATEDRVMIVGRGNAELNEATAAARAIKAQPLSQSVGASAMSIPTTQRPPQALNQPEVRCTDPPPRASTLEITDE